ncbi:MAG: CPBP family intramembrane glutamic endopeptidase [Bacillota bacterium]
MRRILAISLFSVMLMSVVDGFINPGYEIKSAIKILLFLVLPIVAYKSEERNSFKSLFKSSSKKSFARTIILGGMVYFGIMATYLLLAPFIDLQAIKYALQNDLGVNRDNFIYVALYISFINSLMEEFFFRGYIFLGLLERISRWKAYSVSALFFAVYHVAIIGSWFHPAIFFLAMSGLFAGGLIFNYLNERNRNILNSWIVHMMANLAINTVGLLMFGILQ